MPPVKRSPSKPARPAISRDVAEFLLGVVYGINLNAGQDNFDQLLPLVLKARGELQAIVTPTQGQAQ